MSIHNITTDKLRILIADQFKQSFQGTENKYVFVSHPDSWANNVPFSPNTNIETTNYNFWETMVAAKKITSNDISNVIPRYNWLTGTVYRQYDSTDPNLNAIPESANTYYVVTEQYNVYKCLFNNNGVASTVKPSGQPLTTLATSDGYRWKFMYNVDAARAFKFLTPEFMPVTTLSANNGSPQSQVQDAASNGSIDFAKVSNGGSGYKLNQGKLITASSTTATLPVGANTQNDIYNGSTIYITGGTGASQIRSITNYDGTTRVLTVNTSFLVAPDSTSTYFIGPKVTITGDGTGATGYANGVVGSITHVNMLTRGNDYSHGEISFSANSLYGSGATAYPMISPPSGHGTNAIEELAGYNVMVVTQFSGDEGNTFPAENDFHSIGIIDQPNNANGSIANNTTYNQLTRITLNSVSGVFEEDGFIVGDSTSANGSIFYFANTNLAATEGILSLTDVDGAFTALESITANNGTTATISSINSGDLRKFSGDLIYLENRDMVERAPDQIESIKLIFKF
jgi:hypothetical protein